MGVCRSPSLLCGVVFLLALAGSTLGQGDHSISGVVLTSSITTPLVLGSSNTGNFTCTVTVTCSDVDGCYDSMLRVTWFRDGTNITADSDYMVTGLSQEITSDSDMLTSNLTIQGSVSAVHRGQYMCRAVLNDTVSMMDSMSMNLTVQILTPAASLTGGGTFTVGSNVNLTCTVTLDNLSIQNTIMVELLNGSTVLMTSSLSGSEHTSVFPFSNVGVSNAGQYQCRATVSSTDSNVVNSNAGVSNNDSLTVQVPPPSATLTGNIALLGSSATLQCMVTLTSALTCSSSSPVTVMVDLVRSGSTSAITSEAAMGSGSTCDTTMLTISMSASSINGGQYQCRARLSYTESNSAFVTLPTEVSSDPATLYVVGSTVTASPTTVLDVSPYNNFTLTCSITVTPSVTSISYVWSGNHVITMNSSTITVLSTTTGTSSYQCSATVTVSGLSPVTAVSSDNVTVGGTAPPNVPSNVMVNPAPDSATITFTITSVTYTPENYTVQYGLLASNLNMTSTTTVTSRGVDTVHSFIGLTNEVYSIPLNGLQIDTTYFYQVVAMNTVGSNSTGMLNFTTAEAPPGPPNNPMITAIMSRSFTFSWDVPMQPNGVITGYNYSCTETGTMNVIRSGNTTPDTTSVVLTGLTPFTNYNCSVSASTAQGEGQSVSTTERTGEEAPGSPPDNFMITSTDSTTLTLQWDPPTMPNGVIRMYLYFCTQVGMRGEGGNGLFSGSAGIVMMTPSMNATVSGLYPFTNYTCSVFAFTVGDGPGATAIGTTSDGVPEIVGNLAVSGESANMFRVNWTSPMIDNGAIITYSIVVTDYKSGAVVNRTNVTAVTGDDTNQYSQTVTSQQLEQGVPYNVSVAAYTSAGMGSAVSLTEFTVEGAPAAVRNVNVMRINNTAVSVSWTPLTITEARGRLTGYVITLTPVSLSRKRQASVVMRTVLPSESSVTIGGLDPTQQYTVTVAGSTSAGNGNMSIDVTPSPPVPSPSVTPVQPVEDNTVLIAVIVAIGIVVVLILFLVFVILIVCFMKSRRSTTKLHTKMG